jgi:hypothetical protein
MKIRIETFTPDPKLYSKWSTADPNRLHYRIVNADTGEVLTDSQGFGFKSQDSAYKAWTSFIRDFDYPVKQKTAGAWLQRHPDAMRKIKKAEDAREMWGFEGYYGGGTTVFEHVMWASKEKLNFSPDDLAWAWKKHLYESDIRNIHVKRNHP